MELLPCPFCGGDASTYTRQDEDIWSHNQVEWTTVLCSGLGPDYRGAPCAEPMVSWPTHAVDDNGVPLAIAAWNRRTLAPAEEKKDEI